MSPLNKSVWLLCIAALAVSAPVFSASLQELTGPEKAAALYSGPITEVQLRNPNPLLLPQHEYLQRLVAETMNGWGPNLLVETLYLYRKPQTASNDGEALHNAAWSDAERTGLFNQLNALSTLSGIEYYSASRRAMRTFYESSQVIDGPDSKRPLPDPVYATALPASVSLYARQKDLTFGDNIYRYDYRTTTDAVFFVQENLNAMTIGIIPAVGKNKFRTVLAVIDCGDTLLIYAAAMAKSASLPGLGERIGNSFTNRAEAILKWFTGRADTVFQK
jgi:hypothetical protein